jgi:Ca2+/Na+ antiporter
MRTSWNMERTKPTARTRNLVGVALVVCVLVSLLMAVRKPIAHGHRYELAIILSVTLTAIWFLYAVRPQWVFRGEFLLCLAVAGIYMNFEREGRIPAQVLKSG